MLLTGACQNIPIETFNNLHIYSIVGALAIAIFTQSILENS